MKKTLLILALIAFWGCKKQSDSQKHCWQLLDYSGNIIGQICNKTENELVNCTTCGNYYGNTTWHLDSCMYFCLDCDDKGCYFYDNRHHKDVSEKFIRCFIPSAVKIDCNFTCDVWYTRYKRIHKPTNTFVYSFVSTKEYCDSAYNYFNRPDSIIIKNTSDSLILLQRKLSSNSKDFW
jgi:hypothetical protein